MDSTLPQREKGVYGHKTGFCSETQHFPDSPHQLNFPSTIVNVGELHKTKTSFECDVLNNNLKS